MRRRRRRNRQEFKIDNKHMLYLVVIAIVLLFLFIIKERQKNFEIKVTQPETYAANSKEKITERIGHAKMEKLRKKRGQVKEAMMKRMPTVMAKIVETNSEGSFINISIDRFGTCIPGGVDAISHEFSRSREKRLLLTVENLKNGSSVGAPLFQSVISQEEFERGITKRIKLPRITSFMSIGIFLCRDSIYDERCGHKEYYSMDDLVNPISDDEPEDHIYFFQYLVAEPGFLNFIKYSDIERSKYNQIEDYLNLLSNGPVPNTGIMERVSDINQTISPYPAKVNKTTKTLQMKISYKDESLCNKLGHFGSQ